MNTISAAYIEMSQLSQYHFLKMVKKKRRQQAEKICKWSLNWPEFLYVVFEGDTFSDLMMAPKKKNN